LATTGASLVLATARLNTSLAITLEPSIAVTLMLSEPTSPLTGIPENVPVAASKFNQLGSAVPSSMVALSESASPTSMSAKMFAGSTKLNMPSSVAA